MSVVPPAGVDARFWEGRRVLVTGHTGFKGAWLSLWLQSLGATVTGFSRGAPTRPSLYELARVGEDMELVRDGDIRDHAALLDAVRAAKPEVVFHLAAQPLVRRSYARPRETYEVNVMGTVNLLDAVRVAPEVRVVLCVTSDKCYENRPGRPAEAAAAGDGVTAAGGAPQGGPAGRGFSEDARLGGDDPYSSSKAAAELAIEAYRRSFFACGAAGDAGAPRVASARAGNVIGGGDWGEDRLVPDLMRAALDGAPLRVRNPHAIRPWQHVLNPLSGYLVLAQALWEDPRHAGAWNFGPAREDAWPVSRIAERLCGLWPGGLPRVPHAGLPGRLDSGEPRGNRHDHGPREPGWLQIDSTKARERLGWRPPLDLERALAATVEWYLRLREGAHMREVTLGQIAQLTADARAVCQPARERPIARSIARANASAGAG